MKLTESRLKQIIKEEINSVITEVVRAPKWLSDLVNDAYAPGSSYVGRFEPEGGVELAYRPGDRSAAKASASDPVTGAVAGELEGTAYEAPGNIVKRVGVKKLQQRGLQQALQRTLKAGGFLEGILGLPYDVAAGIDKFYDTMNKAGGLDQWDVESKVGAGKLMMSPEQAKKETQFWYILGKRVGMDMDETRTSVVPFQGRLYAAAGRGSRSTVRRIINKMGLYNAREQLKLLKRQQQRNRGSLSKTGKLIKSEIENYLRSARSK